MKIEGPIGAEALRTVRAVAGMTAVVAPGVGDRGSDAIVRFADSQHVVAVEFKSRLNAASAWQVVRQAEQLSEVPVLLIAGASTAEARAILVTHGVSVLDGTGNAHVELPGLLIHREGVAPVGRLRQTSPTVRLSGKAGVVAQALLLDPQREWRVIDLAEQAVVSVGLAHRVLARMEAEGIASAQGEGPNRVRRVTDPTALLDLWAEEQSERPTRTLGYLLAQTPRQLVEQLGANLDDAGIDHALTGAAGASHLAPFVTAVPVVQVWVAADAAPEELYGAAGADPVTEGSNVVFLQAKDDTPLVFKEQVHGRWIANRFRLYRDLRSDPRRGREQADHLRREVIGW